MKFTDIFISKPVLASVVSLFIFLLGLRAATELNVRQYPELENAVVTVTTVYTGADADLIQGFITTPLEQEIASADGIDYLVSTSLQSASSIQAYIRLGEDPNEALTQIVAKVNKMRSELPEEAEDPTIELAVGQNIASMYLSFSSEILDNNQITDYLVREVQPKLATVNGVQRARILGDRTFAMRAWLKPERMAALGITPSEVYGALQQNNVLAAVGGTKGSNVALDLKAATDLNTTEEFERLIIRSEDNAIVRLEDVADVELGSESYQSSVTFNGKQATFMGIEVATDANALDVIEEVRGILENEVFPQLPEGMAGDIPYDGTEYIQDSIDEVVKTLIEAVLIVIAVIYLFLGSLRSVLIPAIAVPLSMVGALFLMLLMGFSINLLTLLAMVLAIGIVVDDAIVVVENVERNIEEGLTPLAAAHQAMKEVSGPIVAIGLVLCAVFVPMAFLDGVTGQFYRQFAVTIAISTVISTINSLTLSPALAAMLLKPHDAPKDRLTRVIDALFGWLFRPFNRFFNKSSNKYQGAVSRALGKRGAVFLVYILLLTGTGAMFQVVPPGFIPIQDKLYLMAGVKLPEGASLQRTDELLNDVVDIAMNTEGVEHAIAFPGLNALQFTNTSNTGVVFFPLKPFDQRERSASEINAEINQKISALKEGLAFSFMPPPILGLGNGSGYQLFIEDRGNLGYGALQDAVNNFQGAVAQTPGMGFPISSYQANVPQLDAEVDRLKAKAQGVSVTELFDTLQTYLGSTYVNDFNRFGRTWQVMAQADAPFRENVEDIARLRTRNDRGEMVPIGSMVTLTETFGPDPVLRYNGYPAADLAGETDPTVLSSAQAMAGLTALGEEVLPPGMDFEWTDLSYQQATQGNAALVVFPLSILLVFLVLAALYESWTLPLAVILIVPMCMLSALIGVWFAGGDNNIFVQVGLVVLIGLACKNAILIVEFARELELQGKGTVEAALEACRLRLRPIIMTSITFTAAVVSLVLGSGAGAEVRQALGTAVFAGMIGVTLFGLFLTPVFYVALRKLAGGGRPVSHHGSTMDGEAHGQISGDNHA